MAVEGGSVEIRMFRSGLFSITDLVFLPKPQWIFLDVSSSFSSKSPVLHGGWMGMESPQRQTVRVIVECGSSENSDVRVVDIFGHGLGFSSEAPVPLASQFGDAV